MGYHLLDEHDRAIALPPGESIIGRSVGCTIIVDGHDVSRRHARLTVSDEVVVEDLGSANGVLVNDIRVSGQRRLDEGDVVTVGRHSFTLNRQERRQTASRPRPGMVPVDDILDEESYEDGPQTERHDKLSLAEGMVTRLIAEGAVDKAQSMAAPLLEAKLAGASGLDVHQARVAMRVAACLLSAGYRRYCSYILTVATASKQVPPRSAVDAFAKTALDASERAALAAYVDALAPRRDRLHPDARERHQRLCEKQNMR